MENKSQIVKLIEWIKRNRKPFFSAIVTILVLAILVIFVYVRIQIINSSASDMLDMATRNVVAGNVEQGLSIVDNVINTYKNSPAAYRAMIVKSNFLIKQKKYEEAEQILKSYIETAKPEVVRPMGYPLLINVYDENNNIDQAISTSKEFLSKYADNYMAPSVMENMARLYELSDKKEEAKQVYKDIVDKFFGTIYANRASDKLK